MAFTWRRGHTVVASAVGLALVGTGVAVAVHRDDAGTTPEVVPTASATGTTTPDPTPTSSPSRAPKPTDPLTGGPVNDHKVIAVKVENIGLARPQVGLSAADIVFAEEVEGRQTRLVAVYHTRFPTAVEPVRSARTTDVQLLPMFGRPGLVYSGANARVQRKIDHSPIVAMYNETRDPRRVAPHNVRVNLAALAKSSKAGRASSIGWTFGDRGGAWGTAARATTVKTKVGNDTFGFRYRGGRYTVLWNGQPYRDGDHGTVTKADNVVVLDVHNHADGNRDVLGSPSVHSDTVGKGKVTIYRDGHRVRGTWSRSKARGPMHFTDGSGEPIVLAPGQTWVALHGDD